MITIRLVVACVGMRWLTRQKRVEIFWSDLHVLYLGWGGSYMIVYICENSSSWTCEMCTFSSKVKCNSKLIKLKLDL